MLLSSTCEEKLLDWLSISSWHSGSRNDSQRRTRFIVQYYIDHGEQLNRGELLERMSNIASHDTSASSSLSELLQSEIENMSKMLTFYAHSGR